jgi:S-adenosylmethionine synthetase
MTNCSEYVSTAHSDKTADAIASHLLDEYIKHDPKVRFALEVQLKDHICNLAGEVTSTWKPSDDIIAELVRGAIRKVGYTAEYAAKWPEGATLNADKVVVNNFIGQQSPDIAQGVDVDGWGDQGCFAGMATNEERYNYLPRDVYFAREIGKRLYRAAKAGTAPIGLDIKTLVSTTNALNVEQVIVAAPMLPENEQEARSFIEKTVKEVLDERHHICDEIIINGTGAYVVHSSVGDAGVVGRKLAVDFYGLNCPIGGGATFGKDGTKADVTLNLYARYRSLKTILARGGVFDKVYTKIGCCIGKSKCLLSQEDQDHKMFNQEAVDIKPSETAKLFGLDGSGRDDMFFHLCEDGLFSFVDELAKTEVENN